MRFAPPAFATPAFARLACAALTVAAVFLLNGCTPIEDASPAPSNSGGRSGSGGAGTGGNAAPGSGGTPAGATGGTSAGGANGTAGSGGAPSPGTGGQTGSDAAVADTGVAPDAPAAVPGEWMGYKGVDDLSQVKKTAGCGMPAGVALGNWVPFETMVTVPANHSGPGGDGKRAYFVKLPPTYDPNKVYKVVIGPSACVNQSTRPAGIDYSAATNPSGGVIQITPIVEPGVLQFGDYVCYDDHDSSSIEYGLIEAMLKEVGSKFCYDQNKVFVQGHSSGGWYANMMGCVYGSTLVRAMSSNSGGLPSKAGEAPPCKETPNAGMWIHPTGDPEEPDATRRAIDRALKLNKCEGGGADGASQTAPFEPYAMNGAQNCKKYKCPAAFPVIFCQPPGRHAPISWHPAAAWAFFDSLP